MTTSISSVAFVLSQDDLGEAPKCELDVLKALDCACRDMSRVVHTGSRGGAIHYQLERVLRLSGDLDMYILKPYSAFNPSQSQMALSQIESFFEKLTANPSILPEATKVPFVEETTLCCNGIPGRFAAKVQYSRYKQLSDGWVYWHDSDDSIRLTSYQIEGPDPRPPWDDEGESLEYGFAMLNAHRSLLRRAARGNEIFIYACFTDALPAAINAARAT